MKSSKEAQQKHSKDWAEIQKQYPAFARAHLAQQAIMMEAVYLGDRVIAQRMCRLLERANVVVVFRVFWERQCRLLNIPPDFGTGNDLLDCLTEQNRDPARCFDLSHGWFDDPFAGGQTLPPKPPDPHIK